MTREELLEKLVNAYTRYFDLKRDVELDGLPVAVDAVYHARDEKYVLTRKAQIWAAESNEYAFLISLEELTEETLQAYFDAAVKEGLRRVNPTGDHMRSDFTLVILADRIRPEAAALLERLKYSKNFLFSLRGWAQLRAVAVETTTGRKLSNRLGRELLRDLERQLAV